MQREKWYHNIWKWINKGIHEKWSSESGKEQKEKQESKKFYNCNELQL